MSRYQRLKIRQARKRGTDKANRRWAKDKAARILLAEAASKIPQRVRVRVLVINEIKGTVTEKVLWDWMDDRNFKRYRKEVNEAVIGAIV